MKLYKNFTILILLGLFLGGCTSTEENFKVETVLDNAGQTWIGDDLPMYPKGKPRVSLLKFTVPPSQKLPKHFHSVINVAYMTKGELTVIDEEGHIKVIKAGEPLVELVGKVHYGENRGDKVAELVVFYINDDTQIPITTKTQH